MVSLIFSSGIKGTVYLIRNLLPRGGEYKAQGLSAGAILVWERLGSRGGSIKIA